MDGTYEVEFVDECVTIDVRADQSILDAGELMGLSLPYRCRMGVCGVCCARREGGGAVDQSEGMFLSPEEREAGYVLTCIGKPRSDLRLSTDSSP